MCQDSAKLSCKCETEGQNGRDLPGKSRLLLGVETSSGVSSLVGTNLKNRAVEFRMCGHQKEQELDHLKSTWRAEEMIILFLKFVTCTTALFNDT